MNIRIVFLLTCVLGLTGTGSRAALTVGPRDNIQLGGFFSQGWLHSEHNNYPTANAGGTWEFRETGLNASTTFGSRLRVGAQVFAQRLGALGGDRVRVDWAVVDYNLHPALGLRAGRVKYPKGLYGEALDLDVVRPFIFLPASNYNPILRDFHASFDGAMLYGSINAGRSSFDYKAFHGDIPMRPDQGVAEFYNNSGFYAAAAGGVARLGMDSVTGGQLAWNTPVSGLKLVYSHSYFTNLATDGPFAAFARVNLHAAFHRFAWSTVSAEYSRASWTFAAEWQRCGGSFTYGAPPLAPAVQSDAGWDGWYVSAARRLGRRWEAGAYHSLLSNRFSTAPRAGRTKADTALSVRFDLNEHVLFKLEAHHVDGEFQTFNTVRIPNPAGTRRTTDTLFAAKTTFSF